MSRTIAIAGAAVLGAALMASLAFGRTDRVGGGFAAAACGPGSVSARVGGRHRCLRAGQRCKRRYDRRYHRYGFHCHTGRLRKMPPTLPSAGRIVARIRLHTGPMGLLAASNSIWVAEHRGGTIARVDPATNRVVARISTPSGQPARLASGAEGLWHLPYSDNTIQELDPVANQVSANIAVQGEADENCCQPAVGAGSVWVPKADNGVYRIDAGSHAVVAHIPIDHFSGSVFGLGSLWGASGGDLFRLDPATNAIAARIAVPGLAEVNSDAGCCPAFGMGLGALWVGVGEKLARVDPSTNGVAALIGMPGRVDFIATTDDAVWAVGITRKGATRLWRIDPATNKVVAALTLVYSMAAGDLTAASGSLWITLSGNDQLLRVEPAAIPAG